MAILDAAYKQLISKTYAAGIKHFTEHKLQGSQAKNNPVSNKWVFAETLY